MSTNKDFYEEFLTAMILHKVQYLIVGGFAVNMYGFARVTEDMDVWINPKTENLTLLNKAILNLGFPEESHLTSFVSGESIMLRLSDNEFRVDLLTKLNIRKEFDVAFETAERVNMPYGEIYFLGYEDLIDEKIRTKRPKDLLDVEQLRKIRGDKKT
jgi:hypothetical protein